MSTRASRRTALTGVGALALALALALPGVAGAARSSAKVTVTFTNGALRVSASNLAAGTTTFVVVNRSRKRHVLAIAGPGAKAVRTPKLAPGASVTLTLTLRKGSYMLSDPAAADALSARWIQVIPAMVVEGNGGSGVVSYPSGNGAMCGITP